MKVIEKIGKYFKIEKRLGKKQNYWFDSILSQVSKWYIIWKKLDNCSPSYDSEKYPIHQSETELSSLILKQFVGKMTHTSNCKLSGNKTLFLFVLLK